MRIAMNLGGDALGSPTSPLDIVEEARLAEAEGFPSAWSVHFSRGLDALSALAVAGHQTDRVELGVGIVPTYPRHPLALAQQAATTQACCARPAPRVVASLPVAVADDKVPARHAAEQVFARYGGLENYRRVFEREGVTSVGALAVVGTEGEVDKQLRRYADIGVTELWPAVFPAGDDAGTSTRRTRALLAKLAPEL